jgi:hypothetical protein
MKIDRLVSKRVITTILIVVFLCPTQKGRVFSKLFHGDQPDTGNVIQLRFFYT